MSEQKIQVGDKVRISYEGVVTDVNKYNEPMIDGGQYFYTDASRPLGEKYTAGKVEILEKRKPQVGDVIDSRRDLGSLPAASVVANSFGSPLIVRHGITIDMLGKEQGIYTPGENSPYKVVYIP